MSFFQKMGNAFSRFMYGRNGVDSLGWASLVAVLLLDTAELIVRSKNETAILCILGIFLRSSILNGLVFLAIILIYFRMFSRNLPKRRSENAWFLTKIVNPLKSQRARSRDKDHKYFTCPQCRTVCRVPRGKGKIIITCPKCGTSIHGKT